MRYWSVLILVFLPALAAANERLTPRPVDPAAAEALGRAISRSSVVRSLVATLEASNVIVHIETVMRMPAGIVGTTRFVTARSGYRYVRIAISADLPHNARTAILGHELQHACEVAASDAGDLAGMRQLFTLEGHRIGEFYETASALETEKRIWMELRRKTSTAGSASGGK